MATGPRPGKVAMTGEAPRLPPRSWRPLARGAVAALCLWLAAPVAMACAPQYPAKGLPGRAAAAEFSNRTAAGRHEFWAPRRARLTMHAAFAGETDEYGHGILGPLRDAKALTIHLFRPGSERITCPAEAILPPGEVFEDIAPRLADLTGDGLPEVIVVQSAAQAGARLAIYDRRARLIAATPPIGTRHRWLAPAAIADLDGDGYVELAYIDRPHLAKILRIWRFRDGALTPVAERPGLTNHRIGEDFISGGLRTCGGAPEIVTANADWTRIVATRLEGKTAQTRDIGAYSGPASLTAALACR